MDENNIKKSIALLQLKTFKNLYELFKTKEFQALLKKLKEDPEMSKNEHLQSVFKSIDRMDRLYKAANTTLKWAPVDEATVGVMLDYVQIVMNGITSYSAAARGR